MPEKERGITKDLAYTAKYIEPIVACLVGLLGFLDKRSQDRQNSLNKQFDAIRHEIVDVKGDIQKKPGGLDGRVTYLEYKVQLIDQGLSGVEIQMPGMKRIRRMFDGKADSMPVFVPVPASRDT